ncbi:MAG TPA: PDDEXK nuclease domain-containing protein [Bacteroidales bacterium]|nr:PDDEXK nuclease domain-containing protein [Bacteroidales bacterium]
MKIQRQFNEIILLIKDARYKAFKAVNTHLIDLYWEIGCYIGKRTDTEGWGKSTVQELAAFIARQEPDLKGFSDKNLWRMKQFYETYKDTPKLSPLVREISWTHNLIIFSKTQSAEEREYYLHMCVAEKFTKRELERQINSCLYERTVLGNQKLSAVLREFPAQTENVFKETYVLDFLNLPEPHSEADLQKQLINQMKKFILELGKDFLFMGEEYRLEVGNKDFSTDLLFYHRGLQCLVAFELKTVEFEPEHLGKINFYLEALDRDVKKPNENPSIGILLCKNKNLEVVEYALNRSLSPTLISQYTTVLPDKKLLRSKLNEFYELYSNFENENEE